VINHAPMRGSSLRGRFAGVDLRTLPRVDVVVSYQGADGVAIDALVEAGARGIVSAGTGAGAPTPGEVEALERATSAGVVVVQASRVGAGRVPHVPALEARDWVAASDLSPWKARILVRLALAAGIATREALQVLFDGS
jgi:L-asparaginase